MRCMLLRAKLGRNFPFHLAKWQDSDIIKEKHRKHIWQYVNIDD